MFFPSIGLLIIRHYAIQKRVLLHNLSLHSESLRLTATENVVGGERLLHETLFQEISVAFRITPKLGKEVVHGLTKLNKNRCSGSNQYSTPPAFGEATPGKPTLFSSNHSINKSEGGSDEVPQGRSRAKASFLKLLRIDNYAEASVSHAFDIKWHLLRIANLLNARIVHHLGIYGVAVLPGFEKYVGKDNSFARFSLADLGEGNHALNF